MSRRSKSLGRQGKGVLPPVANDDERRQSNPKNMRTVSRSNADLPSTSTPLMQSLNGRLSAYSNMSSSSLGPRSIFSKRNSYGRSENTEMLNDTRDQLFESKKKIAELNQKNKVLNTQLNRLKRESERREAHLQSILAGRFQPAELNDTHLAMTLTSMEQQKLENEQIVKAQAERIRKLEGRLRLLDELGSGQGSSGGGSKRESVSENAEDVSLAKEKGNIHEEWLDKHKRKLQIARAHIEQNKELKSKIKELSAELAHTKQKMATTTVVNHAPARVNTADVNRIMDRIQENGILRQQVEASTKELRKEVEMKNQRIVELQKQMQDLKNNGNGVHSESEEMEALQMEKEELEKEREQMRNEQVMRELEKEQLSNEISDLEEERKALDDEREEWVKTKQAYEKVQITMEREMRQMEEVIENLRKDNALLRKRLAENPPNGSQVENHTGEAKTTSYEKQLSPPRPNNIPRLDMRDMSNEFTSPDSPSVNSHVSQNAPAVPSQWDERITYLNHSLVAHIIRQDALSTALEEHK